LATVVVYVGQTVVSQVRSVSDAFSTSPRDGVFDDSELKGFLSDLAAMRRADLGCAHSVVDSDVTSLTINNAMPPALWRELLAVLAGRPTGPAF
jgi:hypothetical protein